MSYRTLKQEFIIIDGLSYKLEYDKENGNARLTNSTTGGLVYENGVFKGAGRNFSDTLKQELQDNIKNEIKQASLISRGQLQPWTEVVVQPEPTNIDVVEESNELFSVTSKDFQSDTAIRSDFLVYPISNNTGQNRILITQRRYVSPQGALDANNTLTNVSNLFSPRFNNAPTQEELLGTVVLPMPNNISESNSVGWGENSLSTMAGEVMQSALGVVKEVGAGNLLGGGQEALEKIKQFASDQETKNYIKQLLTLNAAASVTKFLGINVDPEAFRTRATGTTINPNLELLFNGPKLRSFGFEFKMSPRSSEEARNIRYILKFFKKGMSAKKGINNQGYFLGAPNVFDIQFKGSEKTIGKIKTCALQAFNVNYTPEGMYAAFNDSQPLSVVMQLSFTELTPIYNENYDENKDTVGWDNLN